jgi:hypothetical protein
MSGGIVKESWKHSIGWRALISLGAGGLLGWPLAWLYEGEAWRGWLAGGFLLALSAFVLLSAWRWAGGGRTLAWMMIVAFGLRLGLGVGLSLALPVWGYPEEPQQAGYLFPDAYHRDGEAFALAQSGERLLFNPGLSLASDQYGGLGLTSAVIYRFLSPDVHRPALVLILGSLFFTLGVPFLWRALHLRLNPRAAVIATWIFILYPDGIFFSASQMREPFLLGLGAVTLWGVLAWQEYRREAVAALTFALAAMLFFATRSALFVAGALALLFWLEYTAGQSGKAWKWLGLAGLVVGALAAALLTWGWFREASVWDQVLTLRGSGRLAALMNDLGDRFRIPVILGYGLAQPVLPAAIADPALPLWKGIVLMRSLGWYSLAPLVVYAAFAAWKEDAAGRKRLVLWAVVMAVAWMGVAALRAGGDMTDNPRYRTLFLPQMALAAGWALDWALAHRDRWLGRWLLVEAIFLGFFTQWYFSRYFHLGGRLPLTTMIGIILILSAGVLAGGFILDRLRRSA